MVIEMLRVARLGELLDRHPQGSALDALACLVADTASEVDRLHADLLGLSGRAIEKLKDVSRDRHPGSGLLGVLQSTGHEVELLSARRAALHTQLERTAGAYQRALTFETAARAVVDRDRAATLSEDRTLDDGLRGILQRAKVGIRLQAGVRGAAYLPEGDASQPPVSAGVVKQLIADGVLSVKRSASPHEGQLLSLTDQGEAVLRSLEARRTPEPARSAAAIARSGQSPHRREDPKPSPAQLRAMAAIEQGDCAVHSHSMRASPYVSGSGPDYISMATVQAATRKGWVVWDSTTTLYQGQQLSLSDQGRKALEASRPTDPQGPATPHLAPALPVPAATVTRPPDGAPLSGGKSR